MGQREWDVISSRSNQRSGTGARVKGSPGARGQKDPRLTPFTHPVHLVNPNHILGLLILHRSLLATAACVAVRGFKDSRSISHFFIRITDFFFVHFLTDHNNFYEMNQSGSEI